MRGGEALIRRRGLNNGGAEDGRGRVGGRILGTELSRGVLFQFGDLLEDLHIGQLLIPLRVLDGSLLSPLRGVDSQLLCHLRSLECSTQLSDLLVQVSGRTWSQADLPAFLGQAFMHLLMSTRELWKS